MKGLQEQVQRAHRQKLGGGGGNRGGSCGSLGWWEGVGGKGRRLFLNDNKNKKYLIKQNKTKIK